MSFSYLKRDEYIQKLKNQFFDLVIIGGGINGAGVARDAASRGMKVALIEANDFAFGTSSRSSKLIHGGIRYLENFDFHLVFEALSERKLLFEIAPHLVHPLRFLLPVYANDRVGMFKLGMGMWLYDALSLFDAPQLHERLNKEQTLQRISFLKSSLLKGSFEYSDAYMDDDRLVFETLRSAARQGTIAVNYVKATGANFIEEQLNSITCHDVKSGQDFEVKGKHFVSTVGPWTDDFGKKVFKEWHNILRPSKGIHLTLHRDRLPLSRAIVMAMGERIIFGIPRHEMIIVGTTDTDYSGDPGLVHSEVEDVKYVLKVVDEYFPGAHITKEDIIASYAGVRPLVNDGASTEGKTSREHAILSDYRNVTFVAGGKYTTYRLMSEEVVEQCLNQFFSIEDKVKFQYGNTKIPLNEKTNFENLERAQGHLQELAQHTDWSTQELQTLIDRHGMEALDIVDKYYGKGKTLWQLEAEFAVEHTMCGSLKDFYLRRAPLFLSQKDHGKKWMTNITQVMQTLLSWDEGQIKVQQDSIKDHENFEMSWKDLI